jgi:hypothetical protein
MKKLMIIGICLASFFTTLKAQNDTNEEQETKKNSFGLRIATQTALQNHVIGVDVFLSTVLSPFDLSIKTKTKATPQYGLQFAVDLSPRSTLNIIGTYQNLKIFGNDNQIRSDTKQISTMAKIDLLWYKGESTSFYSGFGIGGAVLNSVNRDSFQGNTAQSYKRIIGHVTFLGLKTNGKTAIFAEVGAGALGIFSGGIKHTF